jgi:DNA-binding NtrC family response regulator
LEELAAAGVFRRDLLFRLQGVVLTLPSLRERLHEFPYLVPRLTVMVAREAGLEVPTLAPGLPQALARLPWPGNIRELRHAIERALLRCGKDILKAGHFPELARAAERPRTWEDGTRDYQRGLLLATLRRLGFQATQAAQDLGLTRPALYVVAKRLGLDLVAEREQWEASRR